MSDNVSAKISVDVEKLKGQAEANSELRIVNDEKFSRIDEQIGELRSMIIDREKDLGILEVKATKAADLVAEVQPEVLFSEVKKTDIKIESVKGKLESYHELNNTILEELKGLRRVVKTFRGIDDVREMLNDANKDLSSYEKIEGQVESRADKIEDIYNDFLKKFDEFKNFKDQLIDIKEKVKNYENEFNKVKDLDKDILKKSEFNSFSEKIHSFINTLEQKLSDVHINVGFINDLKELVSSLESEMGSIVSELNEVKKTGGEEVRAEIARLSSKQENNELLIGTFSDKILSVNNRINSVELSIQGLDLSSHDERILLLEKSMNDSSSDIENLHEALVLFSESQDNIFFGLKNSVGDNVDARLISLENSVNDLNNKLSQFSESINFLNSGATDSNLKMEKKIEHLNKEINEAKIRETRIIESVKNIIDLLETVKINN